MSQEPVARAVPILSAPFDIATLARVPLSQTAGLPAQPGVYLAVDDANRVWYAGIADSIRVRLSAHDRMEDFKRHRVTAIAWKTEDVESHRRTIEREIIERFHPPLNSQHNFSKLPEVDFGLTPSQEIERFFRLRLQLKLIELELEALKPNLVTRCEQAGGKIIHSMGSIQCQAYKSWTFSDEVELLKLKLSTAQKEEKENGRASVKSTKISPVARLSADAMSREVAALLARIQEQPDDDFPEAV